jgi:hypothetical protein
MASQRAENTLSGHADLFKRMGMRECGSSYGGRILRDEHVRLELKWHRESRLFVKVFHLAVEMQIKPARDSAPTRSYGITLKPEGLIRVKQTLKVDGPGAEAGKQVADLLRTTGLLDDLRARLDLEAFALRWSGDSRCWTVHVTPYPGAYLFFLVPPLGYTVKLRQEEAKELYAFADLLARALGGTSLPKPSLGAEQAGQVGRSSGSDVAGQREGEPSVARK